MMFRVRIVGFDEDEDLWLPKDLIDENLIQAFYKSRGEAQAKAVEESEAKVGVKRNQKVMSRNNPAHPRFGMGPIPPPRVGGPQAVLETFSSEFARIPDPIQIPEPPQIQESSSVQDSLSSMASASNLMEDRPLIDMEEERQTAIMGHMPSSSDEVGPSDQVGHEIRLMDEPSVAVEELRSEVQAFHRAVMRDRDYESDSEYYEFAILHENGVRTERGYRIPRFCVPASSSSSKEDQDQDWECYSRVSPRMPSRDSIERVDLYA
jgi:hypothetical protein